MTKSVNTYPIEIAFVSPGACPPVYVAGSFTEPPWEPHELQYSIDEQQHALSDGQKKYVFHRTFDLPKGNFQYKFRLGHNGDWWVCDHTVATGIYLNLFILKEGVLTGSDSNRRPW